MSKVHYTYIKVQLLKERHGEGEGEGEGECHGQGRDPHQPQLPKNLTVQPPLSQVQVQKSKVSELFTCDKVLQLYFIKSPICWRSVVRYIGRCYAGVSRGQGAAEGKGSRERESGYETRRSQDALMQNTICCELFDRKRPTH